jgi:hypothetical protein
MGVVVCFLCLASLGYILISVNMRARDRHYMLVLSLFMFCASLACFFYYAYDDIAAGGPGFRGGDDRLWFEAGQNTLSELKSGRSLYDVISNGVYVDWTSPLHPAQAIETGRIGYPLFLALIMGLIGSNLMAIMVFNSFIGSLTPFVAYKIGESLSCPFDGRKSALFVSLSQLIFYAGANYRDVHIGFLFALSVFVLVRFIANPGFIRFLQIIVLTALLYIFRYISGVIMILGLSSLILIFARFRYKYAISAFVSIMALAVTYIEYPALWDQIASLAIGHLDQAMANVGEEVGDKSASLTRSIALLFIDSPLSLTLFMPLPAIFLQLVSPPVDTTGSMWVLYLSNAVRFIFFLPYVLAGIYYVISRYDNKQLNMLIIIYFIAIIAYAPVAIFFGNRYMISMASVEAVFAGIGSCNISIFQKWQRIWIVAAFIYSIWHWIYKVTPVSQSISF